MAVGLTLPWDLALLQRGGWGRWVDEWGEHNMNDYRCKSWGSSSRGAVDSSQMLACRAFRQIH